MKSVGELNNLVTFLEYHISEDTDVLSESVKEEIKFLLQMYSNLEENEDFLTALKRLEELEELNTKLKAENKDLKKEIDSQMDKDKDYRDTIYQTNNELNNINNQFDSRILELEDKLDQLDNKNSQLKDEIEILKESCVNKDNYIKELEKKFETVSTELDRIMPEYKRMYELDKDDHKLLKDQLDVKTKECDDLKDVQKKLRKEGDKLIKQIVMFKQANQTHNQLLASKERETEDLANKLAGLKYQIETKEREEDEKLGRFVLEIEKIDYNKKNLYNLLERFTNKKFIFSEKEGGNGEIRIDTLNNYETLNEYDDLFNQSITFTSYNASPRHMKERLNSNFRSFNIRDMHNELNSASFVKTPNPEPSRSKKGSGNANNLKLSQNLNYFSIPVEELKEEDEDNKETKVIVSKLDKIDLQTPISEADLNTFLQYLEEWLLSEKNPTTFILTNFERNQFYERFIKAKSKTLMKYLSILTKIFVYQMNFLENHLSNMTKSNSYYQLKSRKLKTELNSLLKKFLEKNKSNQKLLNKSLMDNKRTKFYIHKLLESDIDLNIDQLVTAYKVKKKMSMQEIKDEKSKSDRKKKVVQSEIINDKLEQSAWEKFTSFFG